MVEAWLLKRKEKDLKIQTVFFPAHQIGDTDFFPSLFSVFSSKNSTTKKGPTGTWKHAAGMFAPVQGEEFLPGRMTAVCSAMQEKYWILCLSGSEGLFCQCLQLSFCLDICVSRPGKKTTKSADLLLIFALGLLSNTRACLLLRRLRSSGIVACQTLDIVCVFVQGTLDRKSPFTPPLKTQVFFLPHHWRWSQTGRTVHLWLFFLWRKEKSSSENEILCLRLLLLCNALNEANHVKKLVLWVSHFIECLCFDSTSWQFETDEATGSITRELRELPLYPRGRRNIVPAAQWGASSGSAVFSKISKNISFSERKRHFFFSDCDLSEMYLNLRIPMCRVFPRHLPSNDTPLSPIRTCNDTPRYQVYIQMLCFRVAP